MKLRKTLLVVLTLVFMVCLSSLTIFGAAANDKIVFNASEIESATIKDDYSVGQEISFPSSITVEYKGVEYEAKDGLIYFPSGACYDLSSHVLSEVGYYTLEYFFEAEGGVKVTAAVSFRAFKTYYNFALEDGSKVTGYAEPGNGSQDHENDLYTTKLGGLKVDIKEGNTFNFNVPIDLRKINNIGLDSSNIAQYTTVGGHNSIIEYSEFVQFGSDIYSFENIDANGNPVADQTAISTSFISAKSSPAPELRIRDGKTDPGLTFTLHAYNKGKVYLGTLKTADGVDTFTVPEGNYVATSSYFSNIAEGVTASQVAYIRVVIKYANGNNFGAEDIQKVYDTALVARTVYTSYATAGVIRFTDAYDPNVWVEAEIRTAGSQYWQKARSNHQQAWGYRTAKPSTTADNKARKIVYVDGQKFLAYSDNFGKLPASYTQIKSRYGERISFDIEKNRIYSEVMGSLNAAASGESSHLLNDLNNDATYKDNHFQGFTTGEVYVSFRFDTYSLTSAQMIIHSIGEYKLEDLLAMEGKTYVDETDPSFTTDFETTDEFGVYASIGDTVTIPEVKSWDVNKSGEMAVNVYRNYESPNRVKVSVKNNEFTVASPDKYVIEYSQKDAAGNMGIYTIPVIGVTAGAGKSIAITTDRLTSVNAGSVVQLPKYTVQSINDMSKFNMKITVSSDKETIIVNNDTMSFVPKYSGTYTIKYEFNDNFGVDELVYTFESVANETSVLYEEVPLLPRYFIKGQKYNLDKAFAYKFETGAPVLEEAKTYAIFDGGERVLVSDVMRTEITGSESVYFVYELDGVEYTSQTVEIVDVTYYENGADAGIDLYKYFVGNVNYNDIKTDGSGKREGNIIYYANEGETDAKLSFVNSMLYQNFSFEYQIREEYANFNKLIFTLTGVKNPSQKLVVELVKSIVDDVAVTNLYINGEFIRILNDYVWANTRTKSISYTKATNTLLIDSYAHILPLEFDGNAVYFDIELKEVEGVAGVFARSICSARLSGTSYKDNSSPLFSIVTSQGEYAIGDEVTLQEPIIVDVLNQVDPSTLKFAITDTNGQFVTSKDGVKLDGKENAGYGVNYVLKFDRIDTYNVKYYAKDYLGNEVTYVYLIDIIDVEEPVITLSGVEEGKTYSVNKWGVFDFSYSVSDNLSQLANITVDVVLWNVDNNTWRNNVGTSIQFYQAGNFKVQVLAQDEEGNFSSVYFYIKAE